MPLQNIHKKKNLLTAYMVDSASTTADNENVPTPTEDKKGIWNRLSSIIPPAAERQKLIPLALMFFCILFNYTILRDTKDVLMVSPPLQNTPPDLFVIVVVRTHLNFCFPSSTTGHCTQVGC
jgi:AAA family ATP:ADP antiporter